MFRARWRALAGLVLLGVLLASSGVGAQSRGRPYRVGVLNNAFLPGTPPINGLRAGIKAEGLEDGRDVKFDIRNTGSDDKKTVELAAALAKEQPHVIVTVGAAEAKAARTAAPQIPIVFMLVPDPVADGLVASIARPGGHLTGISNLYTELMPKRVELARELVPNLRCVLFVYDAQDLASAGGARAAQEAAAALKVNVALRPVRTQDEAVRELKTATARDVILAPAMLNLNIIELILNLNLYMVSPAIFSASFWVQAGGVASYGVDYHAEGLQAARLVVKILRGARPADLPVEGANKIELAINRKTLQAFGLTIPPGLALRVDQVFEKVGE